MIKMQVVTIGKKQGLVFPIFANGCVKIDYEDNVSDRENDDDTSNDVPYGIWGHKGSFCFDAIITPYETNGSPSDIVNTKKAIPDSGGSFTQRNYATNHEATIFHSTKLKIYLDNNSATTDNYNNPAAYGIKVELTTASTTTTLISDTLIFPSVSQPLTYSADILTGGFNNQGRLTHTKTETLGGSAHGGSTTFTSGTSPASNLYYSGEELFIRDGFNFTSIGTVTNLSGTTVTLSGTPSSSLNSTIIYREALKEATYVDNTYHIGVRFDNKTKKLDILFNGRVVKTTTHTEDTDFQLDAEDLFLGANGTNQYNGKGGAVSSANLASTNKQFYGVLHEVNYSKGIKSAFEMGILEPIYQDSLLFLNFEEVDM